MNSKSISDRFSVLYRVASIDSRPIEEQAVDITVEQTVEVPWDCIPKAHLEDGIVGRVESISQVGDPRKRMYDVTVSYRCDIAGNSLPQFLNILFGNISLKDNIRICDISVPEQCRRILPGPNFGIEGLRRLIGVFGRPLACAALKPMGLNVKELASMSEAFARGGADLIKDDHGIADQKFHPFNERVARCQESVENVNASTGRTTLYIPMISGSFDQIEEQVRFAVKHGVKGLVMAPMLVGLDTVRYFAEHYNVVIIAHPAFSGTFLHSARYGIKSSVLLGTLFRLIGADASIFPNSGGRFNFKSEDCLEICTALRRPFGEWKPSFPCPAGGMKLERLKEMACVYGMDSIFLIGGALLQHPKGLSEGISVFMDGIRALFTERLEKAGFDQPSSCMTDSKFQTKKPLSIYNFHNYRWDGCKPGVYKRDDAIPFKGISRWELIGSLNSKTDFDLRYFEISPGGYSSLEKHVHEHVIIGLRGRGILLKSEEEIPVNVNDIAYIGSNDCHQIRNDGEEPFGFFCLVDRRRDKPTGC